MHLYPSILTVFFGICFQYALTQNKSLVTVFNSQDSTAISFVQVVFLPQKQVLFTNAEGQVWIDEYWVVDSVLLLHPEYQQLKFALID